MQNDLYGNNFPAVQVIPVPPALVGAWSGSMGPYLTTLKLDPSGVGLMCTSWNGRDSVSRLKYDGNQLRMQDGSRLNIVSSNDQKMHVEAPYFGGANYTMYRDDQLVSASPYCAQQL